MDPERGIEEFPHISWKLHSIVPAPGEKSKLTKTLFVTISDNHPSFVSRAPILETKGLAAPPLW